MESKQIIILIKSYAIIRVSKPNQDQNHNKNSEKPKSQTAIFFQNHGLQFFARNSALNS